MRLSPNDLVRILMTDRHMSRRDAMKHIAGVMGLAGLVPLVGQGCGSSGHHASGELVGEPEFGPEDLDVDTVVFVMMENRSFDHIFGSLSLVEGRTEVDGYRPEMFNAFADGTPAHPHELPYFCVIDPAHSRSSSRFQFAEGTNAGFIEKHLEVIEDFFADRGIAPDVDPIPFARQVMGYHTRAQLPWYYGFVDEFALCQRWFASFMGQTWPNRWYFHSATSNGYDSNRDEVFAEGGFPRDAIYDRLDAAGIPWGYYFIDLPFQGTYLGKVLNPPTQWINRWASVADFLKQAEEGTLPNVCVVEASTLWGDDHPPRNLQIGQAFLSAVFGALAKGPHWEKCLLVVMYDEHGGFYDHVIPPKTEDEFAAEGFDQMGFRVPAVIGGPYVKRGYASNTVLDHTSCMKFLSWLWDLPPLTIRDEAANAFLDVFDAARVLAREPRTAPALPETVLDESQVTAFCIWEGEGGLPEGLDAAEAKRMACVAEKIGYIPSDLERVARRGGLPREFDRRDRAPQALDDLMASLRRNGLGGWKGRG